LQKLRNFFLKTHRKEMATEDNSGIVVKFQSTEPITEPIPPVEQPTVTEKIEQVAVTPPEEIKETKPNVFEVISQKGYNVKSEDELYSILDRYKELEEQVKLPKEPTFQSQEHKVLYDWIQQNGYVENPNIGAKEFYEIKSLDPNSMGEADLLKYVHFHKNKSLLNDAESVQILEEAFEEKMQRYDSGSPMDKLEKKQAILEARDYINSLKSKTVIPEKTPDPSIEREQAFIASHRENVEKYFSNKDKYDFTFKVGDEEVKYSVPNLNEFKDTVADTSRFIANEFIKVDSSGNPTVDIEGLARMQMIYKNFDKIINTVISQTITKGKTIEAEERRNSSATSKEQAPPTLTPKGLKVTIL
jgi:hypothetical protein